MANDIPVRCACGQLEGVARGVDPSAGNNLKCYCDDCQSFQHFLDKADAVLDEHGGTQIFQMSQGNLEISRGRDRLACVRLRPGGTFRWYASCCRTPIGNTVGTSKIPFVGVVTECLSSPDGGSLDASLGPIKLGVHGRYALGEPVGINVHKKAPPSFVLGFIGRLIVWRLRGDHKRSPFFDADGKLNVTPKILAAEELAVVEASRDRWSAHH